MGMSVGQLNTVARAGELYRFSLPMTLAQAKLVAGGLSHLPQFAEVAMVPTTKRGEVRLRYTFTTIQREALRQSYTEHESAKAMAEGGAFVWSRQMSLDRAVQRAECRNPGTGGVYYVTRRVVSAELVFACTCTRFAMSKLPCKHILDAQIRQRFEALGFAELPSSSFSPLNEKSQGTHDAAGSLTT